MRKNGFLFFLCSLTSLCVAAQSTRYIVRFKDKSGTPFSIGNPSGYLSQRAIVRRTRYALPVDSTDLPVAPRYVDSVRLAGSVSVLNVSKWLNQVSLQTTDAAALSKINAFPFVESVMPVAARTANGNATGQKSHAVDETTFSSTKKGSLNNAFNYGRSFGQVHIHNGEFLHNLRLQGQGMIIGMLDAGFYQYTSLQAFDSVNANRQVLGTYDFVAREASVTEDDAHGMECFSIIAANIPGTFVGTAPKASFYLFRSEDAASEYPIEEHNWVCAAERVDSAGGDVISSSLGYTTFDNPAFNHAYAEMNGNSTMATRGADLASKKGILVLNAAGNEGGGAWRFISSPADGDSVIAVGAVRVDSAVASFSSYGPSSDGQVKPDVASVGWGTILQYPNNTVGPGNGTSFACPNIAGLASCLWQGFPEMSNTKIINALRFAGHKATAPDNRVGFGIPDMRKAVLILLRDFSTASATVNDCRTTLSWTSKDVAAMKYEIERKGVNDTGFVKIAERSGTGLVFATHTYQYTDVQTGTQNGDVIYRIRQVADTAAASLVADYIDSVTVAVNGTCNVNGPQVTVYPNPDYNSRISVRVITEGPVQNLYIRVVNALGHTLLTMKESKAAGAASFDLPVARLPKGTYFVSVYGGKKRLGTERWVRL